MTIARDISRQASKQTATLTASQTAVTVTGGFSGSSIDVYLNGSRIVQGQDYSLNGTSGITLSQGASAGDIIEFVIRNTSNSGFSAADTGQIVDGAVTYDKLSDSSTESDNVTKRVAKAWGSYNGSTNARGQEYNVSSITDNGGVGNHTVNLSITMSSTDYCVVANEYHQTGWTFGTSTTVTGKGTTSFQLLTGGINGTTNNLFDSAYVAYAVFGS